MPTVGSNPVTVLATVGFLACALISGFVSFEATRRAKAPLAPSQTALVGMSTPWVANTSTLAMACLDACGPGGICDQSTTGITTCTRCGLANYTGIERCVDTTYCSLTPWCTHAEALLVQAAHTKLLAVATTGKVPVNGTYNITDIYPYTDPISTSTVPIPGYTSPMLNDLLNDYLLARTTSPPLQTTLSPAMVTWFDDANGWWGGSIGAYLNATRSTQYVTYLNKIKKPFCAHTWKPSNGTCIVPL